ncbi:BTAD domain-containing putative transcriptional regulator [Cloacibacillus porcorum]|uniref:BTAD domain-containing putative transcriptional regulator n=1 Tax=Cloacibacillus porcorum TaxID=1197717 RepID=UPI0023F00D1F|nr:BTAD domain-containing putative transcriptional regulator [Cloacibacillus porcorum]
MIFYLKENEAFSDWASMTAREIKESYCLRGRERAAAAFRAHDFGLCRSLCGSLLGADKYDEYGYRYLMLMLEEEKKGRQALKLYEKLNTLLWEELSQEPEPQTTLLARRIKNRPASAAVSVGTAAGQESFFMGGRQR